MTHRVAVIAGGGAGPEVIAEARKTVDAVVAKLGLDLAWNELPWGSDYFHETGTMMQPDALDVAGDIGGSGSTSEVGDAVAARV